MGLLSVFCGVLASNRWKWDGPSLLTLVLVLLLAGLGWGTLWNMTVGVDWARSLARNWPPARPASLPALPYTQPESPSGRLLHGLNRAVGWWRESLGQTQGLGQSPGLGLVGLLMAVVLIVILSLALPARVRPLNALVVALIGLGIVQRWRGALPLASLALMQVGLGWLAGHLAFADASVVSWAMALAFALAVLGGLRAGEGLGGGLWLLNGAQMATIGLLVALRQPLAASIAGLFLLGQIVLQPALRLAGAPVGVSGVPGSASGVPVGASGATAALTFCRRAWPWLAGLMLVVALAVP